MVLRPEYALGHSEFNDFLFAFVGVEKNGIQLTVLSALARLDLDPWGEATRLSTLTREAATSALAAAICALPEGQWNAQDSRSIASRLVGHLPNQVPRRAEFQDSVILKEIKPKSKSQIWLTWIAFALVVLIVALRVYR